jgi:hypothetical protein
MMNNDTLPGDWKRAIVVPVHEGCDQLLQIIEWLA